MPTISPISSYSIISAYQKIQHTIDASSLSLRDRSFPISDRGDYDRYVRGTLLARLMTRTQKLLRSINSFEFTPGSWPPAFRTADVSDPDKISANAFPDAAVQNYLVGIDRLAAAKANQSVTLASKGVTTLEQGIYTFTISVGQTTYYRSIAVEKNPSDPDTNKDVFRKLKWALESTDASIETVITEKEKRKYTPLSDELYETVSWLTIRNKETGETIDFSIHDETGALVETLRLNRSVRGGRISWYEIDSTPSSAETNTVLIDKDKLSITFLDTTGEPVSVRVEKGARPVEKKLIELISSYNDYMDWIDQNSLHITTKLKSEISDTINVLNPHWPHQRISGMSSSLQRLSAGVRVEAITTLQSRLKSIGLEIDEDGRLLINDKFSKTVQRNFDIVRDTLGGEGGFFTTIKEKLEQILEGDAERYRLEKKRYPVYDQRGFSETISSMMTRTRQFSMYI